MGYKSHLDGTDFWNDKEFTYGNTVIESTVRIFNHHLVKIGSDSYIGHNTIIKGYQADGGKVQIGSRVWIGENCYFNGAGGINIDDGVGIGPGVSILTSSHDFDMEVHEEVMRNPLRFQGVALRKGCDIGFGTKILPGVTIGEGAVIGAGSVVTKDVLSYSIAFGNPCVFHRLRDRSLKMYAFPKP